MDYKMMKALQSEEVEKLMKKRDNWLISKKIDGIRAGCFNGLPISNSGKVHRNLYIQLMFKKLEHFNLDFDGELVNDLPDKNSFSDWTQGLMRIKEEIPHLKYYIFDIVDDSLNCKERYEKLMEIEDELPSWCELLEKIPIRTYEEAQDYVSEWLEMGFEGGIINNPDSKYKRGRATKTKCESLKMKNIDDAECEIIGFNVYYQNNNAHQINELGYATRSESKVGKIAKDMLGSLEVVGINNGFEEIQFKIGSGFTDNLRKEIWKNKDKYIGKIVKYKYMKTGILDKPRHPVFLGFRDIVDL